MKLAVATSTSVQLPGGTTFTDERAASATMLQRAGNAFARGSEPGFDLSECANNPYNDWIGAQIRADVYGWVCPGEPEHAADLASRDAALSHPSKGRTGSSNPLSACPPLSPNG